MVFFRAVKGIGCAHILFSTLFSIPRGGGRRGILRRCSRAIGIPFCNIRIGFLDMGWILLWML